MKNINEIEKYKCLWCNVSKKKEDLSVIYGSNAYFNKNIFYGCKGEHIEKIKEYLTKTEKLGRHHSSWIKISLIAYPSMIIFFSEYIYWITILIALDFSAGLYIAPFSTPDITEKIGIYKNIILLKIISMILITSAVFLIIKYIVN